MYIFPYKWSVAYDRVLQYREYTAFEVDGEEFNISPLDEDKTFCVADFTSIAQPNFKAKATPPSRK